jgi:hypothetical protein
VPWRKSDQEARRATLWLPVGRSDLCPITTLEAWLAAAGISEGLCSGGRGAFHRRASAGRCQKTGRRPLPDRY